jgi:feruloyl esterase
MMAPLRTWVETKIAPDRIEASRVRSGKVERTRPLCRYPQTAVYKGSGSTDDAANFVCK